MVDGDIIFGRLYYHCNKKYGYPNPTGSKVEFFANELTSDGKKEKHCIQFPLLASVLEELKYENKKYNVATNVSVLSLIVSAIALVVSFLSRT